MTSSIACAQHSNSMRMPNASASLLRRQEPRVVVAGIPANDTGLRLSPERRTFAGATTIGIALMLVAGACQRAATVAPAATAVPSVEGRLVLAGGGALGPEIVGRFIELAGGPAAPIVVIPTAGEDSVYPGDWEGLSLLTARGATNLVVRHTADRRVADSDSFVAPIRRAHGVWLPGGRQWRLVDAYAGTRTERELHALLARGGVIGGTSAGASIQSSYMVRGAREGNTIVMAPGYETGFGFIRGVAVDQHVSARNRQLDLQLVVARFPNLLGLGLDEGTAIVVDGTRAAVVGRGNLFIHNGRDPHAPGTPYTVLSSGDTLDLATRRKVGATR
jgi:cyanophycinase